MADSFFAAKHPPEYRLHKYWARKPHNVVADFLRALVPPGGAVLDPFCGSGVVLAEARALGLCATGIDLNPAAALISRVTADPPDPAAFFPALDAFLAEAHATLEPLYRLPDGDMVRYCVHAMRVTCPGCGRDVRADEPRGRRRACPTCGLRLRFNVQTLAGTDVIAVITADGLRRADAETLEHQNGMAYNPVGTQHAVSLSPDDSFLPNPRILAFDGLHVADLFTPRALEAACLLRKFAAENPTLLALFSAVLAGLSRLIAYRDGLTGGGPAWSVPGFWVAPIHIEHNPLPLLESWARRYRIGVARLWDRLRDGPPVEVIRGAAQDALRDLVRRGESFDLVFFDPPYGDSVPYLEFSALWNAFLRERADPDREIVVSDRAAHPSGWVEYEARLAETVRLCEGVLRPGGAVLVTFNNLDGRAWSALLRALHGAGLRCESAHYVAPAVISAKAQFAPDGSYQGDFWCVFRRGPLPDVPAREWPVLLHAAIPSDADDPQRRRRLALRALLLANLPAEAVLRCESRG